MSDFKFIDLFAGIGGFHIGARDNGGECAAFSDIHKGAIEYYIANHGRPEHGNLGDITNIKSLPKHDLLMGGVPCQSWSIAGKNLGFDDDRGKLWENAIAMLEMGRPKAFLFENVKGLVDNRNKEAFDHILDRLKALGYNVEYNLINSSWYGAPQARERVYIVGFLDYRHYAKFRFPQPFPLSMRSTLGDVLGLSHLSQSSVGVKGRGLSSTGENNDYFIFSDVRDGANTIHSWDIRKGVTPVMKDVCVSVMRNRRKSVYGPQDGNPMTSKDILSLTPGAQFDDIVSLVDKGILECISYTYAITDVEAESRLGHDELQEFERLRRLVGDGDFSPAVLKAEKQHRVLGFDIRKKCLSWFEKGLLQEMEVRYDLRYRKISAGIDGIYRVFLPSSDVFPTLVASDMNDYVLDEYMDMTKGPDELKRMMVDRLPNVRKLTKEECCEIQGFPRDFILPEKRSAWMHLVGNSVSVPVIRDIVSAIKSTGVFES